jgi:hypothetical protein
VPAPTPVPDGLCVAISRNGPAILSPELRFYSRFDYMLVQQKGHHRVQLRATIPDPSDRRTITPAPFSLRPNPENSIGPCAFSKNTTTANVPKAAIGKLNNDGRMVRHKLLREKAHFSYYSHNDPKDKGNPKE